MTFGPKAQLGLLLGMVTGGCALPKDAGFDEVKRLVGERAAVQLHWDRGTKEDQAFRGTVRDLLHRDLTIASASQIALLNNPRLQATYERLGVAQADLIQAGLLRNPSISGGVGFPIGTGGGLSWDISIVQEFLDLFLLPLRKRFARAEVRRVQLEVADAVLDLLADVRSAFFMVQAAEQVAAMRRTILNAAEASAELAQGQHDAGTLSDLDLASEQGLYAQAKLDLARSQVQVLADRERLSRLLGVWGQDVQWKIETLLPELPPEEPPLDHLESFAVAHRLDLLALRQEMQIGRDALSVTRAGRIFGSVEAGGRAEQDPEHNRVIGPTLRLELPLFNQGQAAIARLKAQLRQHQQRLFARAIEVRSEVRVARTRILASRATVEYYKSTLLPLRERIVGLSQLHYNAMLLGVYQLLQAKQNQVNAYREYIEAVRDYWIARSDLERACGGPIPRMTSPPASQAPKGENP